MVKGFRASPVTGGATTTRDRWPTATPPPDGNAIAQQGILPGTEPGGTRRVRPRSCSAGGPGLMCGHKNDCPVIAAFALKHYGDIITTDVLALPGRNLRNEWCNRRRH